MATFHDTLRIDNVSRSYCYHYYSLTNQKSTLSAAKYPNSTKLEVN